MWVTLGARSAISICLVWWIILFLFLRQRAALVLRSGISLLSDTAEQASQPQAYVHDLTLAGTASQSDLSPLIKKKEECATQCTIHLCGRWKKCGEMYKENPVSLTAFLWSWSDAGSWSSQEALEGWSFIALTTFTLCCP